VISSSGSWVKLHYGPRSNIEQVDDSRGQTVRYVYNERNQLTGVTYMSGETLSFTYDDANQLTAFSASPDGKTPAKVLLTSSYQKGLLASQVLADGSTYLYRYGPVDDRQTRAAQVRTPDGKVYMIRRFGEISGVWETDADAHSVRGSSHSTAPGQTKKSGGKHRTGSQTPAN
jgi:YD repeat-containing protein